MEIGVYGPVFKTERGQLIADIFDDLRGGRTGLYALDFAKENPHHSRLYPPRYAKSIRAGYGVKVQPENHIIVMLKRNRAAVAEWLEEQGLKVE